MQTREEKITYIKEWQKTHRENTRHASRKWHLKNKERENLRSRQFRKLNPNYANEWHKKNIASNIQFFLRYHLRNRLSIALRRKQKVGSAIDLLGCTIKKLRLYFESKFNDGMNWDNYGRNGWHIDHIKPLALFNLTDEKQLAEACHYTNLQPLWAKDNYAKNAKYE